MAAVEIRINDSRLSTRGRVYVALVVLGGAVALGEALDTLAMAPPPHGWLVLAALTWASGTFAVKVPSLAATISVSEVFVFALAILFGAPAAVVTVAVDGLLSSLLRRNLLARRVLFNVAEPALSISVAGAVYTALGGPMPLWLAPSSLTALVFPVLGLAITYLVLNTALTATAMAFESGRPMVEIWSRHIAWLSVNFIGGASVALLLVVNMREVSLQGLVLILPLVAILYLVFRTWTGRIHDAESHVEAVNRLYLSTVEALAIAIESKDQVTHGHVRRVQRLSLAIARALNVTDATELKALEAGALLHDMGKVAIPDYILNKPGKLTAAEYERMKLHAPIGAEILSAVDFPYPVVPIVRHHHEHWNGSGYPDGLAGEAIPLGARILAVVDCFDALTSDRPYRRALTTEEALAVIRAKSGTLYDPAITAALEAIDESARSGPRVTELPRVSDPIVRATERSTPTEPAPSLQGAGSPLQEFSWAQFERTWSLVQAQDKSDSLACPLMASFLRAVTPATTVLVGVVDDTRQCVRIVHIEGHGEQVFRDTLIPLGEGISGWVAANQTPIVNSDPALDLPDQVGLLMPRLVAALSVPMGAKKVLTLYTDRPTGFSATDRLVAEQVASRLEAWVMGGPRQLEDASGLPDPPRTPVHIP